MLDTLYNMRGPRSASATSFSHWLEEAAITRTRIKMYMGHAAKDVTDLYLRHELAAYLESDAALLREYLGEQRGGLKVVKA